MINRAVLVGRITKDPELKMTKSGIAHVRFSLAVNRKYKNQSGEREADFISCIAWRHSATFLDDYVKKGMLLAVDGSIQTGSYFKDDGTKVYTTDIIAESVQLLEKKKDEQHEQNEQQYQPTDLQKTNEFNISDDDLPF